MVDMKELSDPDPDPVVSWCRQIAVYRETPKEEEAVCKMEMHAMVVSVWESTNREKMLLGLHFINLLVSFFFG